MTSTWSPSAKFLRHSSDVFFTTLRLPVTQFCLKYPTPFSPLSITWSQMSPSQFRQFCWSHLISQWQMTLHSSTTFFITLCLPLKKVSVSPDTFSSHLIPTDKLLRHSCDTFFTTLVYQWRMTPSLFRHFFHNSYSASDEFPHHSSDNFFPSHVEIQWRIFTSQIWYFNTSRLVCQWQTSSSHIWCFPLKFLAPHFHYRNPKNMREQQMLVSLLNKIYGWKILILAHPKLTFYFSPYLVTYYQTQSKFFLTLCIYLIYIQFSSDSILPDGSQKWNVLGYYLECPHMKLRCSCKMEKQTL
jgi:hypothetical protein